MLPMSSRADASPRRDLRLYMGLAALAFVLIGADVLLLSRAEAQPSANGTVAAAPAADLPPVTNPAPAVEGGGNEVGAAQACAFAPDAPVHNWQTLVDAREPVFGNRNANVTVIEFFEPNCPHCAHLAPVMEQVERANARRAKFIYKPVIFWPYSTLQTQALYAAGQENPARFQRLLKLQMERQKPAGFNETEVRALATQAGMNADALMQRINSGVYRGHILAYRDAFSRTGANTVPLLLINGRKVGENRTAACLGQLIQQAAQG
jgi:protein-disulfide isomerase